MHRPSWVYSASSTLFASATVPSSRPPQTALGLHFVLAPSLSAAPSHSSMAGLRARLEQILGVADFGSLPSGHLATAATISVALASPLQSRRAWLAVAACTVPMTFSRTRLGAHWPRTPTSSSLSQRDRRCSADRCCQPGQHPCHQYRPQIVAHLCRTCHHPR